MVISPICLLESNILCSNSVFVSYGFQMKFHQNTVKFRLSDWTLSGGLCYDHALGHVGTGSLIHTPCPHALSQQSPTDSDYRQFSNIKRAQSQNINVSCLVLQLSWIGFLWTNFQHISEQQLLMVCEQPPLWRADHPKCVESWSKAVESQFKMWQCTRAWAFIVTMHKGMCIRYVQSLTLWAQDWTSSPHMLWAPSQYKDRLIYVWRFPC